MKKQKKSTSFFMFISIVLSILGLLAMTPITSYSQSVYADFNGDGKEDLAVGIPNEDIGSIEDAGAVNIIYGSTDGLTSSGNQFFSQDTPGINGVATEDDHFGYALAAGDFNLDGYADLAIGIPGEDVGGIQNAGAVTVLFGSSNGLSTLDMYFSQDTTGILNLCEEDDQFGWSLVIGDFNGDNYFDLAIGVPYENLGTIEDAGAVNIIYGTPFGLLTGPIGPYGAEDQFWSQNIYGIPGVSESGDRFGWSLGASDFNNDGCFDLAVGVPDEDIDSIVDAGAVNVLYGSDNIGLTSSGSQFWSQNSYGIPDSSECGDGFGRTLATGDFDGDGYSDLAVGVPCEDIGSVVNAGAINVLYGSDNVGLAYNGSQFWSQNTTGVPELSEYGDNFGHVLAAGDFDGDGCADLAIGVPNEDEIEENYSPYYPNYFFTGEGYTGAVNILLGSEKDGIRTVDSQLLSMSGAINFDQFGFSLVVYNFNGDDYLDLAIGIPGKDLGSLPNVGAVNVRYGSDDAFSSGSQLWFQYNYWAPGLTVNSDPAENNDKFGISL